jgi:hypothetical protein
MPTTMRSYRFDDGIHPAECQRCGTDSGNWGTPVDNYGDGDLMWQCGGCGNYTTLPKAVIERRIRQRINLTTPRRHRGVWVPDVEEVDSVEE